jgi:hypothetical protein
MISYNLILLNFLLGQTQFAIITSTIAVTKSNSFQYLYFPTELTAPKYQNNCTYGTVYNGNACDGKISMSLSKLFLIKNLFFRL